MGSPESKSEQASAKKGSFEKVGECLYRYTPNGTYYARVEKEGKEFRRSLRTNDRAVAKRKLADFQREISRMLPGANRTTMAQLADTYLATPQHLEKSTQEDKGRIVRRIKGRVAGRQQPVARQGAALARRRLAVGSGGRPHRTRREISPHGLCKKLTRRTGPARR